MASLLRIQYRPDSSGTMVLSVTKLEVYPCSPLVQTCSQKEQIDDNEFLTSRSASLLSLCSYLVTVPYCSQSVYQENSFKIVHNFSSDFHGKPGSRRSDNIELS